VIMEKAREFLSLFDNSNDYRVKFLSLYNGLYLILKDDLWKRIEDVGIKEERMKDALLYLREDEERGGKTVLGEDELLSLRSLLVSLLG
ncbi:MAG: hypothetical protein ACI4SL_10615, partial [Candidatus Ornithospirochaeta sp.]